MSDPGDLETYENDEEREEAENEKAMLESYYEDLAMEQYRGLDY